MWDDSDVILYNAAMLEVYTTLQQCKLAYACKLLRVELATIGVRFANNLCKRIARFLTF